jgi:hypothetical protein
MNVPHIIPPFARAKKEKKTNLRYQPIANTCRTKYSNLYKFLMAPKKMQKGKRENAKKKRKVSIQRHQNFQSWLTSRLMHHLHLKCNFSDT